MSNGLKQRIVGVIVLASLGLILLPLVFDFADPQRIDRTSLIPPAPEINALDIPIAKRPDSANNQQTAAIFDVARSLPSSESKDKNYGLDESGIPRAWVLQVGSFSEQSKANELTETLRGKNFKAFKKPVEIEGKTLHRVYIGPKLDRRRVLADKEKVDKLLATNSIVINYVP